MEKEAANELVFLMGKYAARLPIDRRYAANHMWCLVDGGGAGEHRFGFTAYAVRLLQDVYFLDWSVDSGEAVTLRQEIGSIESSKAVSSLYAPLAGRIVRFNEGLLADPSAINLDGYGSGWLFDLAADISTTMAPADYVRHLDAVWPQTQRTIKGQL
jgi:glycine cleavage system H protein